MHELGWVELQLDKGTERRRGVGARGRKPRQAYRLTEKGKTALVEGLMGGLSRS
jgi:DNA-binding PadR family transcriptional regulator